jgi:hypothetical protein
MVKQLPQHIARAPHPPPWCKPPWLWVYCRYGTPGTMVWYRDWPFTIVLNQPAHLTSKFPSEPPVPQSLCPTPPTMASESKNGYAGTEKDHAVGATRPPPFRVSRCKLVCFACAAPIVLLILLFLAFIGFWLTMVLNTLWYA